MNYCENCGGRDGNAVDERNLCETCLIADELSKEA